MNLRHHKSQLDYGRSGITMQLSPSSVRFCISTCKKFAPHTIPVIVPSLLATGIAKEHILIVNGGWEAPLTLTDYEGVPMLLTQQNAFEYTPLIEILENNIASDYWFLLHDTCIAGPLFPSLALSLPVEAPEKVAMKGTPSMSIGLYRMDYLQRHRDRLMAIKNHDSSPEALQYWKQWGVPNEDYMLWKLSDVPTHVYHPDRHGPDEWNYQGHADPYNTGHARRIEYFPQLDLYKAKSNWQGVQPHLCIDI
jgi:hypothetical protein